MVDPIPPSIDPPLPLCAGAGGGAWRTATKQTSNVFRGQQANIELANKKYRITIKIMQV